MEWGKDRPPGPNALGFFRPGGGPGDLEPRRRRLTQGSRGYGGGGAGGSDGGRDWVSRWRRRGHEERGGGAHGTGFRTESGAV